MDREDQDRRDAELGYRSAGARELALRDWMALRGDPDEVAPTPRDFAVLVNRLRASKWAKDNPAKANARSVRWQKQHRDKVRAAARRRLFKKWIATAGKGIACVCCGVLFCEARPRRGRGRKFCTRACHNRFSAREWYRLHRKAGARP